MSVERESGLKRPPFAALMDRLGISQADLDAAGSEPVGGEAFMVHRDFESQRNAEGLTRYPDPTDCDGTLRIQDESGVLWPCVCDGCGFEVHVAVGTVDPDRLLEHRLGKAGIPPAFVGKAFEKGDPLQQDTLSACRVWLRQFKRAKLADSIPAVALYGKPGRGKSHLLALMVETLIRGAGADAVYCSASDLFDQLQAGMDEGLYEVRWQRVLRAPVLALDDLGAGRWTEWRQDRFAALVDHRYAKGLPLLVATNIPPAGWDQKFGERTASRLRGLCLRFELQGRDRRDTGQQSFMDEAA